jgi:aminotransferase
VIKALPEFPWEVLAPHKRRALEHPDGIVNLALGEPVDPTPEVIRRALREAANAPGYPPTEGMAQLREAAARWLWRRLGVTIDPSAILPTVGSKELVAWLPTLLGTGPTDIVIVPKLAYPTYEVSARLAGARSIAAAWPPETKGPAPRVVWINSPSNPEGRVLSVEQQRALVIWARNRGSLLVNDECYIEHGWTVQPMSILHPEVCGGSHKGLLAVHSLSKRSNVAGYRAGFIAGDLAVVQQLLAVRRHAGHVVPTPVQAAMIAALSDDAHVAEQRIRYQRRRLALRSALESAGFRIDHSDASLFLWATRDEPCWNTVKDLAELGILVAPGQLYGQVDSNHVRVAFTATDERIQAAVDRLTPSSRLGGQYLYGRN